jgi:uncharacterized protein (DUF169 family)
MKPNKRDYSVLDKFNFSAKPVGIKYSLMKPDGVERLKKKINLCEMVKEAQTSNPFYAQKEDFQCVEPELLGMQEFEPMYVSGMVGEKGGVFGEARANRRLYQDMPRMPMGSVRYASFASVDKLTFDPDILSIVADNTPQAQALLRALSYQTGEAWASRLTPVAACSWLFIYPILSGKYNYAATGLSMGMSILKAYPTGKFIFSIPWDQVPGFLENVKDVELNIIPEETTREENWQRILKAHDALVKEVENG